MMIEYTAINQARTLSLSLSPSLSPSLYPPSHYSSRLHAQVDKHAHTQTLNLFPLIIVSNMPCGYESGEGGYSPKYRYAGWLGPPGDVIMNSYCGCVGKCKVTSVDSLPSSIV